MSGIVVSDLQEKGNLESWGIDMFRRVKSRS
jgi:hypothetical protein